jgi:hypothetical protein
VRHVEQGRNFRHAMLLRPPSSVLPGVPR